MKIKIVYIFLIASYFGNAQNSLDELLGQYNNESIPYITITALKDTQDQVILFDAREKKEFEVSHIRHAKFVGYDHFKIKTVTKQNIPKDAKIVVYCSLGVRSEDISEKLKKAGYTNVYNLYGGIFEWKNKGNSVLNSKEEITEEVHACSKNGVNGY